MEIYEHTIGKEGRTTLKPNLLFSVVFVTSIRIFFVSIIREIDLLFGYIADGVCIIRISWYISSHI